MKLTCQYFLLAFILIEFCLTTYFPGMPKILSAGKLISVKTQIPFEYYYLPFCKPENSLLNADNLGEILTGDYSQITNYNIKLNNKIYCQSLCNRTFNESSIELFKWFIDRDYKTSWYLDNLPAAYTFFEAKSNDHVTVYDNGVPIGFKTISENNTKTYYIYNHLRLVVLVHPMHKTKSNSSTVVGFSIEPLSLASLNNTTPQCSEGENIDKYINLYGYQELNSTSTVYFTYDIDYKISKIKWSSRWDYYLLNSNSNEMVHWQSIGSSSIVIAIFSGIVLFIFLRAVKKDIELYNNSVISEEIFDDSGWKRICNDVFRKPKNAIYLCSFLGTGIQVTKYLSKLFCMIIISLIFACFGFLSPQYRGTLLTVMLLLFVFMGIFAGYYSARFYKMFQVNSN